MHLPGKMTPGAISRTPSRQNLRLRSPGCGMHRSLSCTTISPNRRISMSAVLGPCQYSRFLPSRPSIAWHQARSSRADPKYSPETTQLRYHGCVSPTSTGSVSMSLDLLTEGMMTATCLSISSMFRFRCPALLPRLKKTIYLKITSEPSWCGPEMHGRHFPEPGKLRSHVLFPRDHHHRKILRG
jgi:hypothetical protein